jgi:aminoglycoside/choline kinase family phosphotransferase
VPEIYAVTEDKLLYLEEDLGNMTLFSYLTEVREQQGFTGELTAIYEKVLDHLVRFQTEAGPAIDYSVCYPRASFDKQSMLWDLHYFKYYFLKLAKVPFDEQELEDDFHRFADYLVSAGQDHFLYRDFQSRNVMLIKGEPWFIDYQGGRRGALYYDLASLLYDAKADLPEEVRARLRDHYLEQLSRKIPVDRNSFGQYFHGFVLIRIMQALGAYGFRGFYEQKAHFLQSIPYALQNLEYLLGQLSLPVELPALRGVWEALVANESLRSFPQAYPGLTVRITSFSYKNGIPMDESGHGGGFVFDCRALPNPGRLEQYRELTGRDEPVIRFLDERREVQEFFEEVKALTDRSVENYLQRNFHHLMISFGCTGGQHRSVYMAERMTKHLQEQYDVKVVLKHRELEGGRG